MCSEVVWYVRRVLCYNCESVLEDAGQHMWSRNFCERTSAHHLCSIWDAAKIIHRQRSVSMPGEVHATADIADTYMWFFKEIQRVHVDREWRAVTEFVPICLPRHQVDVLAACGEH